MNKLSIPRLPALILCWLSAVVLSVACGPESNPIISVTSVVINPTSVNISVGESILLTAMVLPENATDRTVAWSSSDVTVASVSGGEVTALKAGEATITALSGNSGAFCLIWVQPGSIDGEHEGTEEKIWE